jgi:hypothetical protein
MQILTDAGSRFAERRAVPRYPLMAEIEVFEPLERAKLTASISEIGLHGCYIRMSSPLQQNTVIQLLIRKHGESFKSWGMVVYAHEGRGMGMEFFRPEPSQVKILRGWITNLEVQL